jgi:hypothetical protein
MTHENRPGSPGQPEHRLVVRSVTDMASADDKSLAGFTGEMQAKLLRLHDVLGKKSMQHSRVKRVSLEFKASQGMPIVNTEVEYSNEGPTVRVDAYPQDNKAEIQIRDENHTGAISLHFDTLRDFVLQSLPEDDATFNVSPNPHVGNPVEMSEDIDLVDENLLKTLTKLQRRADKVNRLEAPYTECWVSIARQERPLVTIEVMPGNDKPFLKVNNFYYWGTPEEVEYMVKALAELIAKPFFPEDK